MPGASDPVVINTGPILALSFCHRLELLPAIYARVVVPSVVCEELLQISAVKPPKWMDVVAAGALSPRVAAVAADLDPGETAVIPTAIGAGLRVVAIDERDGRRAAGILGLKLTGSIGILTRAKALGLLDAVKPCLEAIQGRGYWYGKHLVAATLRRVGEV
jgi:predicted nucleic acid-binding protein